MENAENKILMILNLKGSGTEKEINQTQWKWVACLQTQVLNTVDHGQVVQDVHPHILQMLLSSMTAKTTKASTHDSDQ